jgi:hypothetical protein
MNEKESAKLFGEWVGHDQRQEIAHLNRKLCAAKSRALYWSGNPSFTGKRFNPSNRRRGHDNEYELALCDVRALQDLLTKLDGKVRKPYDPKLDFRLRFVGGFAPGSR